MKDLYCGLCARDVQADRLDGERALDQRVEGLVDGPHGAEADAVLDLVAPDGSASAASCRPALVHRLRSMRSGVTLGAVPVGTAAQFIRCGAAMDRTAAPRRSGGVRGVPATAVSPLFRDYLNGAPRRRRPSTTGGRWDLEARSSTAARCRGRRCPASGRRSPRRWSASRRRAARRCGRRGARLSPTRARWPW